MSRLLSLAIVGALIAASGVVYAAQHSVDQKGRLFSPA
jgi:hypothetical protein